MLYGLLLLLTVNATWVNIGILFAICVLLTFVVGILQCFIDEEK